jgi:hypothetical protein
MRKYGVILAIFLSSINMCGQLFQPDPVGLDYFNKGSELLKLGDCNGADSLLTLALRTYKNANVYYNRAIARILKTDTLGFCQDLDIAANQYFDRQSEEFYNKLCCTKVDTIYYDRKRIKSDKSSYRYYEIIKYPKYDSIIIPT